LRLPGLLAAAMEDARCLHVAIGALLGLPIRSRASWIGAARAAAEVLSRDPRRVALEVRCAAAAMTSAELAELIARRGEEGKLGFDALEACRAAVAAIPREELEAFGDRLRASAVPEVRRVALWAVAQDREVGWTPERLARLGAAVQDASPLVAGAAGAIAPPREATQPGGVPPR
jgi:hypothetical protein